MSAWFAWDWTSPDRSPSAISTPAIPSARSAGSAWESPSNRPRRRPRAWPRKASCRCWVLTPRLSAARNLDQIRVSVCYGNFNVLIAGAHGGVSVGPDGATHQALEDLFAMQGLPNMSVVVPCDIVETRKATELPAAPACGAKVYSLCPRGHAHRHRMRKRPLSSARPT